jgi:hypothetical protein
VWVHAFSRVGQKAPVRTEPLPTIRVRFIRLNQRGISCPSNISPSAERERDYYTVVQLATPDALRGRVGAVNFLFVNTSYQLGEFESGITASLFGAMPAAALSGLATIAVALLWMKLFPTLRNVERME